MLAFSRLKLNHPPGVLVFLFLAVVLWAGEYVRRDLWEPDEARYAYVADEMRAGNHWLVPHRNGEFYAHKPPLMFWLINLTSLAIHHPVGPVASRLPSLLGGLLALFAITRLAVLWYGTQTSWRIFWILPAVYLFWHQVGMGQIDALLCGLQMAALYCLFTDDSRRTCWRPALAYIFMGLAILAKGPVGLLVPLGVYITAHLAAGEGAALKRTHWIWGIPLSLAFPALWLLGVWLQGAPDGYFHELLFKQNVDRAAGELGHRQPFYYFFMYFPLDFMPWTLFLPALVAALWKRPTLSSADRRLIAWIGFVILFFTMSSSKRNLYTLLAFPAAALLIAAHWDEIKTLKRPWLLIPCWIATSLWILGGIVCLAAPWIKAIPFSGWALWPCGIILLGGGVWMMMQVRKGDFHHGLLTGLCLVFLLCEAAVGSIVFPAINPLKTPQLLTTLTQRYPPEQRLLLYRINGEILALYAQRRGQRIDSPGELSAAMTEQKRGLAIFPAKQWNEISSTLTIPITATPFDMGSKQLVAVEFDVRQP